MESILKTPSTNRSDILSSGITCHQSPGIKEDSRGTGDMTITLQYNQMRTNKKITFQGNHRHNESIFSSLHDLYSKVSSSKCYLQQTIQYSRIVCRAHTMKSPILWKLQVTNQEWSVTSHEPRAYRITRDAAGTDGWDGVHSY